MGHVFLSLTTGTNVKSCNRWSQLTLSVCNETPEHTDTSLCSSKSGASEKRWLSGQQGQQKQEPMPWSWLKFTIDHPQMYFCRHNHNGLLKNRSFTMIKVNNIGKDQSRGLVNVAAYIKVTCGVCLDSLSSNSDWAAARIYLNLEKRLLKGLRPTDDTAPAFLMWPWRCFNDETLPLQMCALSTEQVQFNLSARQCIDKDKKQTFICCLAVFFFITLMSCLH